MIYLFRKLFGKSKIKFLGRAGLIFIFDGTEYFIDSEMLAGKVDIVIYTSTVTLRSNSNIILDNALKEKVIKGLVEELKKNRVKFEMHDQWTKY